MQEYLNTETYEYKLANEMPEQGGWVRIPKNANYAGSFGHGVFFSEEKEFISQYIVWVRPTQPEALPFIDDEPQQSIEATLKERGSRYGDFESVAETTRALMRVLGNGDTFDELSASQHEALHMICSKMARIVNGDPDYKDNWHDIGGYAKLIENNI